MLRDEKMVLGLMKKRRVKELILILGLVSFLLPYQGICSCCCNRGVDQPVTLSEASSHHCHKSSDKDCSGIKECCQCCHKCYNLALNKQSRLNNSWHRKPAFFYYPSISRAEMLTLINGEWSRWRLFLHQTVSVKLFHSNCVYLL
jgi:hypothetical protein